MTLETTVKGWWTSFTHWLNGTVAIMVPIVLELGTQLPDLKAYLPDNLYKWAFYAVIVANIYVRQVKTKTALTPLIGK